MSQSAGGIAHPSEMFLQEPWCGPHHGRVQAYAGHGGKRRAVAGGQVHAPLLRPEPHPEGGIETGRDAERSREQVGGAPGDDGHRRPAVRQRICARPDRAVTPNGEDQPFARGRRVPVQMGDQLFLVLPDFGPHELGLPAISGRRLRALPFHRLEVADPDRIDDKGHLFHFAWAISFCCMTTCEECGYEYESVPTEKLAGRLRDLGPRYREALAAADVRAARRRPAPEVWSALEYACHMRDVLLVQRDRAIVALAEDTPAFARMYRDERVNLCHYSSEPLGQVLDDLEVAARLCATVFDGLDEAAWERTLVYNLPAAEPTARPPDVAWLARHTVHEGEHHLMDVNRALAGQDQV